VLGLGLGLDCWHENGRHRCCPHVPAGPGRKVAIEPEPSQGHHRQRGGCYLLRGPSGVSACAAWLVRRHPRCRKIRSRRVLSDLLPPLASPPRSLPLRLRVDSRRFRSLMPSIEYVAGPRLARQRVEGTVNLRKACHEAARMQLNEAFLIYEPRRPRGKTSCRLQCELFRRTKAGASRSRVISGEERALLGANDGRLSVWRLVCPGPSS
jgi:hypothetical protein